MATVSATAGDEATPLQDIADLLRERNEIDARIAALINHPMTSGHLGEWTAQEIFDITLTPSASTKAIDGHFQSGRSRATA